MSDEGDFRVVSRGPDGKVHATTSMPNDGAVCDFCGSIDVHWSFPCRDFTHERKLSLGILSAAGAEARDVNLTGASAGGWAACNVCAALIKRGDRDRLAKRSARTNQRKMAARGTVIGLASIIKLIRPFHDDFWANREGEPVYHEHRPRTEPDYGA